ncbi:hypothetical protein Bca4012_065131 [Brassica carinata]
MFINNIEKYYYNPLSELFSFSCLTHNFFIDNQGIRIHASVGEQLIKKYDDKLHEGDAIVVQLFKVVDAVGEYRTTSHPYKICFFPTTFVGKADEFPSEVPEKYFADFTDILEGNIDSSCLVDVIGQIVNFGSLENKIIKGKDNMRLLIELRDPNYAKQVYNYSMSNMSTIIICVIRFCSVKEWKGAYSISSGYNLTHILLNPTLELIEEFKACLSNDSLALTNNDSSNEIIDSTLVGTFVTLATIESIDPERGWEYLSCKYHNKKLLNYRFFRFKILVHVKDDSGEAKFLLFDANAHLIVRHSAAELYDEGPPPPLPRQEHRSRNLHRDYLTPDGGLISSHLAHRSLSLQPEGARTPGGWVNFIPQRLTEIPALTVRFPSTMENRKLTSAEKGKNIISSNYQAPRTGRIRMQQTENHYLLHKHSLTLIGKVTNPSVQKVWALLAFFTEHWKTERKPVGADLGQGMFQFEFELESDLISVLEKRPYHFAKWMVIIQRWEPTTSPHFPSLIPFWIKIQGIPVHLWTEETVKSLGEDIGIFEAAGITSLSMRMRVHINGRLPLIKQSVIEYSEGDEVVASFVYERLEKHCSMWNRLDHELRDCLEAKARKKAALKNMEAEEMPEDKHKKQDLYREANSRTSNYLNSGNKHEVKRAEMPSSHGDDYYYRNRGLSTQRRHGNQEHYHPYRRFDRERSENKGSKLYSSHSQRTKQNCYPSRASNSRTFEYRPVSRNHRDHPDIQLGRGDLNLGLQDARSPHSQREVAVVNLSQSKSETNSSARGAPLRDVEKNAHKNDIEEAMGEVREAMKQYTACADPTERAAREARMRKSEALGEVEETAIRIVQASLANPPGPPANTSEAGLSLVANQRRLSGTAIPEDAQVAPPNGSAERSPSRISAKFRLGPQDGPETKETKHAESQPKRKVGRPPGKAKVQASPLKLTGVTS